MQRAGCVPTREDNELNGSTRCQLGRADDAGYMRTSGVVYTLKWLSLRGIGGSDAGHVSCPNREPHDSYVASAVAARWRRACFRSSACFRRVPSRT